MISIGVDFSITGAAITVHCGDVWNPHNCNFFAFTDTKRILSLSDDTFQFKEKIENDCKYRRYQMIVDELTLWMDIKIIRGLKHKLVPIEIFIEGYSMNSRGRVWDIAECTMMFKMNIRKKYNWDWYNVVEPTVVKKEATGKGNAKKFQMVDAFIRDTQIDLYAKFGMKPTMSNLSPIADIADSYFICRHAFQNYLPSHISESASQ